MKVTLFGAAGNFTGSAYYLHSSGSYILIDFGIFQGDKSPIGAIPEGYS